MPPSSNQKQEQFYLLVLQGYSDKESYKLTGYKPRNAKDNATKLRKNTEVLARIQELNMMEGVYSNPVESEPLRPICNINVVSPEGKRLTQRILNGERTG